MTSQDDETVIGPNSRVSLTLLGGSFTLLALVVGYAVRIDARIQNIEKFVEIATRDRWTASDMDGWVLHLRDLNPDLRIPDPTRKK